MSEGDGDYEEAQIAQQATQEVLIPAVRDMGSALEKVNASVAKGAQKIATDVPALDNDLAQGFPKAAGDLGQAADPAAAGIDPDPATAPSGLGADGSPPATGTPTDDFAPGATGGQGAEGTEPTPTCNDPIDPVSGQMLTSTTDLELPGVLPLVLRRAYASNYRHGSLFGPGWSSTLDQRLIIDADGIHYLGDDAQMLNYGIPTQPGQQMLPAAGARWPLTWDRKIDAIAILDPATGVTRHFAPPPREATAEAERWGVWQLTRITDRNDNWLVIARDEDGVPTQVNHVGGYRIAVDSSFRGGGVRVEGLRLIDQTQPQGTPVIGYNYDPAGHLVEILDTDNVPLIYEYDVAHRITAWIDRAGYRYDYTYDAAGHVIRAGGEHGVLAATFDYDVAARCTRVVDSYEAVTEYWYDQHNHLAKVVDPLGNATLTVHDRYGRLTEHTDPLGNTTRFLRDEVGNAVEVHRPDGARVTAAYNAHQQPVQITSPSGAVTTFDYDDRGNLIATSDPTGAVTRYVYTEHGGLAAVTDALGNTTRVTVDRAGLPLAVASPLGAVWRVARDERGQVASETDPLGNVTTIETDAAGSIVGRIHPDGSRETWSYDARGNVALQVNQAGFETRFEYGPFRRLLARTDPDGARYEFAHDRELRLTAVKNPLGATWAYEYDVAGNLVAEQDFNNRRLAYTYDAAGQVVQRVNGAGETITLVRDRLRRLVERRSTDGSSASFEYGPDDELAQASNQDAQLELVRDAAGRVVAETVNGRTLTKSYDALGNRISRSTPTGRVSSWRYDASGRPLQLDSDGRQISFGYDDADRESHRWLGASTALTSEWDPLGRLTARRLLVATGPDDARTANVLHERLWTYRADGNPESLADAEGTQTFALDPLGRVTAVSAATWVEQYAYDMIGNLMHAADSRTPDSPTAGSREVTGTLLRRAGRTSYAYDLLGRLTKTVRRTLSGGQKVWEYTYDSQDRMTAVLTPDGQRWRYKYDPLGRRIAKQCLGADGEIVEELRFTWDGAVLVEEERHQSGHDEVVTTAWDYETRSWTPLAQDRRTFYAGAPQEAVDREFHAIVTDLVGTPTELVTPDGAVSWRRSAGLWDNPLSSASDGQTSTCPLRFPGQYHDSETGFSYNYQRYYDPAGARYVTPDPLGLCPAPNNYVYIENPLVALDPLGLARKTPTQVAIDTIKKARGGTVSKTGGYHGRLDPDLEKTILSDPDGVYQSEGGAGNLIFHKGGDVVITEGPGSSAGKMITSYGQSGPRGESGASIFGGSPEDPGMPVTAEQIANGGVQRPDGGYLPKANKLDIPCSL